MSLGVYSFRNTGAMRVIFFSTCSKFHGESENAIKIPEMFLVFQIIASEVVVGNCPYYYDNSCSWQSTC